MLIPYHYFQETVVTDGNKTANEAADEEDVNASLLESNVKKKKIDKAHDKNVEQATAEEVVLLLHVDVP